MPVIPVIAVFLNLLWLALMFFIQSLESRTGRIPKRKKYNPQAPTESVLYLRDFSTITWGDTVGLSLVDFGITILLQRAGPLPYSALLSGMGAALSITLMYHIFCLHFLNAQDSMYPAPKTVSWTGRMHLAYVFAQLLMVSLGFWILALALFGKVPLSLSILIGSAVGLCGGALYLGIWFFMVLRLKRFLNFVKLQKWLLDG